MARAVRGLLPGLPPTRRRVAGWGLIEWLVGLAIGLWLSAAALEALLWVRAAEVELGERLQLGWQARHALDTLGQQLRQAGSTPLRGFDPGLPPAQQTVVFADGLDADGGGVAAPAAVWGLDGGAGPDLIELSHEVAQAGGPADCLGQAPAAGASRVRSRFWLSAGALRCLGSGGPSSQPLSNEVEDLQLRYWLRQPQADGLAQQQLRADQVGARWADVDAVEVCLHLAAPAGARRGVAAEAGAGQGCEQALPPDGRVHVVLRQTYRLRGRGGFL